ncbi:MAG: hypothetical protein HQ527_04635 [Cyanobacteria bacterium]|nr:hypothetical protein [Cyanobacteria bacterium bin.51]
MAESDSADRPAIPATAPLRGPAGSLIYSGSDGRQYIVSGMAEGPGQLELTKAFDALRGEAAGLRDLINRCQQWVEAASAHGLSRPEAASVLLGQLAQALENGDEPGSTPPGPPC